MYIARVPNRTSPPAILLRESFREKGKVKFRTLTDITSWAPERIEAMDRALQGEPLAVRVFEGNSGDPATVAEQIRILREQFHVTELVFVGDRVGLPF
jgi:hypothetical protein